MHVHMCVHNTFTLYCSRNDDCIKGSFKNCFNKINTLYVHTYVCTYIATIIIIRVFISCYTMVLPHCLSCDFTWSAKPTLEKQTSQLSLVMQQYTGSV